MIQPNAPAMAIFGSLSGFTAFRRRTSRKVSRGSLKQFCSDVQNTCASSIDVNQAFVQRKQLYHSFGIVVSLIDLGACVIWSISHQISVLPCPTRQKAIAWMSLGSNVVSTRSCVAELSNHDSAFAPASSFLRHARNLLASSVRSYRRSSSPRPSVCSIKR